MDILRSRIIKSILLVMMILVLALGIDVSIARAKVKTYYEKGPVVGGTVPHATKYKYTYNTKNVKKTNSYKKVKELGVLRNRNKTKRKRCSATYSVEEAITYSIGAGISANIAKKITKGLFDISVGVTKTYRESTDLTISESLPPRSEVKVILYHKKKEIKYPVKKTKLVQQTNGKWKSVSTTTKTVKKIEKVPCLETK